jgi:hypothetical protein
VHPHRIGSGDKTDGKVNSFLHGNQEIGKKFEELDYKANYTEIGKLF